MRQSFNSGRSRGLAAFALILAAGALAPGLAAAGNGNVPGLDLLVRPTPILNAPLPPADISTGAPVQIAQSRDAAQLAVRIQDLEETVRTLTGQIEGLQFQMTQMQELIQKMQNDNEFRFQQLEGGDGKKSDAATQSGGVTSPGALPQAPATGDTAARPAPLDAAPPANDGLGESADPLVGKGTGTGQAVLGTLPDGALSTEGGRPLDLSLDGGTAVSNGDANAQFKAGYEAIMRGDYAFAEDQFRQFVSLYPKDPQAADATNYLGDALLQRGAFDEAADILLTGYQSYPNSTRAPDLLLKLGVALAGAGEQDTACRTFFEVSKRYPSQPAAFGQRLKDEKSKAQCPA